MFDSARGGLTRIRWMPCQNLTGNDIPGFAVMRVTGIADPTTTDNEYVLQVDQPNSSPAPYCVNGPQVIKAQSGSTPGWGICSFDFPNFALYDSTSGTPAVNDGWGPKSGSWKLVKGQSGFNVFNQPTEGRVLVMQQSAGGAVFRVIRFQLPSALTSSTASVADCPVIRVASGADPGATVTVTNEDGWESDAGSQGWAFLDNSTNEWIIFVVPCATGSSSSS